MTKQRNKFLAELHQAREVFKTQDPKDVALVKSIYDAMLRHFGDPECMESLSDKDYAEQWEYCRVTAMSCMTSLNLISTRKFITIWNAYDTITTEQAMSFA